MEGAKEKKKVTFQSNEGDNDYVKSLKEQAWKLYHELEENGNLLKYIGDLDQGWQVGYRDRRIIYKRWSVIIRLCKN